MKQATRSTSESPSPGRQAPQAPMPWPDVRPAPAVWEKGFMASRETSRIPSLYRPRKIAFHQPEPTW